MKASITYLIVSVIIGTTTYAQNFQTINSSSINYYISSSQEYVLASRIDSVELQGSDSVFYSFKTMRDNPALSQNDPCKFYLGDSWLGPKIEIKSNGQNIFYNKDMEPIVIETQAAVDDTFLVYHNTLGDSIWGTVSNEVLLNVFGETDVVRIIDLFANYNLPFANPRIVISESNGFIEMYPPYSFPNIYGGASSVTYDNDYPEGFDGNYHLVGINDQGLTKPRVMDVYNHEIGDLYQFYSSHTYPDGSFEETFFERKIINKFFWQPDSMIYFVQDNSETTFYPANNGQSVVTSTGGSITQVGYYNVDEWHRPGLPEEFDGINGWNTLFVNECGDIQETHRQQPITVSSTDGCASIDNALPSYLTSNINGIGELDTVGEAQMGTEFFAAEVSFYNKNNGIYTCGSQQFLQIENTVEKEFEFGVFPNPTSGDVYFDLEDEINNAEVTVVDDIGRIVKSLNMKMQNKQYLDLNDVDAGLYTIIVRSDDGVFQQRLLKH
ncbi:T9SS type A sorting domain-containing protein [Paracrocinitomix mangrovi]|uniref:T9SS type A sorting domain-containing protein n=1 Tax=Paracrocinitomix mangrovi TaxID=2862509 RepID=UPI001C8E6F3E|nr:T9SS type A sorting domain-containing protein [Paracrocinitomix mangrovi]UKN01408.1 T9SS type A sorting domain-containing protein [Paracrocinitomix mangrovi]